MASRSASRRWGMRLAYILVGLALVLAQLLPLEFTPRRWSGPDLLVVLTIAWAARRPNYVPALSVAGMILLADLVLLRPPGVMAALLLVACELLRRQAPMLRDTTFMIEWLTAAAAFVGIGLMNRLVLAVFLVDQAPLGLTVTQIFMNVLVYPLVVGLSYFLLGLHKIAPGDDDAIAGTA
ncbi:rod shape-determining protein MreD [Shimia litoralis]|uniref:Rod shape-determining protein MreD n=1 Tax=Shimia litoralis TaxID=420403 RepID=A0A4U7N9I3_9RHOB|nr:rod shape-determining protein MreD [Shimia litoralis]TKZ22498.1 rod shape-determining protein MreD [Shimia litoralis]